VRLLEVGSVVKPHGLAGEVIVSLVTDRTERLDPGSILTGVSERFDSELELTVSSSRPHQGRWIVGFEGWSSRNAAEMLRGTRLCAPPIDDGTTIWVHDLIGAAVHDAGGELRGRVVAVEANPASDLLVLDTGALVPVRFIADMSPGRLEVDAPEGIFDLGSS
jgi:16S rRNA processing protein RimM